MPTDPKYLQNFSCFESLSRDQLQAVAEITNAVCYPSGYVLFEEGNPGDRLFFLMKGSVPKESTSTRHLTPRCTARIKASVTRRPVSSSAMM